MTRPGSYRPFAGFSGSAAGIFSGKSRTAIRLAGYLSLLIFLSLSPAIAQDDGWDDVEGISHIRVLVDTEAVAPQGNSPSLQNYPVLLQLSSENSCGIFDQLSSNSDRKKMAVYSPEGTQCDVKIESWGTETEPKSARIWVDVPRINACCKEIVLRLYYDSSKDDNVHVADITEPESGNYIDNVEYICPATGEYAVNTLRANGRTASGDSVTLDWSGYVEPETEEFHHYNIYKSESLFSIVTGNTPIIGPDPGEYAFTVSGLTAGTRYYFAVVPADANDTPLSETLTPVSAIPEKAISETVLATPVTENITVAEPGHWTLCGSPYIINSSITVNAGATLTIDPGVIVKFASSAYLTINGTLDAQGTSDAPIYFTSIKDDSVGGDTDGDTDCPDSGDWNFLQFNASSTGNILKNAVIRYAGRNYYYPTGLHILTADINTSYVTVENCPYGVYIRNASPTISGVTTINNNYAGFYITGKPATIKDNKIINCTGPAIVLDGGAIKSVVTGNIRKNVNKDFISVSRGTITESITWKSEESSDMISDMKYIITGDVSIGSGTTLNILAGTIMKFDSGGGLTISGTLKAIGTPEKTIYFTSLKDDAVDDNDTNGDGSASSPKKGDWRCLYFASTSLDNELDHVELRYGGSSSQSSLPKYCTLLSIYTSGVNVSNSVIKESGVYGIYIYNASPIIENVEVANNGSIGIYLVNSGTSLTSSGINIYDNSKFGIFVKDSNDILIENLTISGNGTGISLQDCNNIQVIGNTFTNNGIGISVSGKPATITGNTITGCTGNTIVLDSGAIKSVITGNTLENVKKEFISVSGGTITESITWKSEEDTDMISDLPYVITGGLTISSGTTMTIRKGTIIKFDSYGKLSISGTLKAQGTSDAPIYLTSLCDDAVNNDDTNGDGENSIPVAGNWFGLIFNSSSTGNILENMFIRYAGSSNFDYALTISTIDIYINNLIVENNYRGVYVSFPYYDTQSGLFTLSGITASDNTCRGFYLKNDNTNIHIKMMKNIAVRNGQEGIYLDCSKAPDSIQLINNKINSNGYSGYYGVHVKSSSIQNINENAIWGNKSSGIYLENSFVTEGINGNEISTNMTSGIVLSGVSGALISNNRIFMNRDYGIQNNTAETVYAPDNWWGDDSGPSNASNNPEGTGDKITDNVMFNPSNNELAIGVFYQNFCEEAEGNMLPNLILDRGTLSNEWHPTFKAPERTAVMDSERVQLKYNNLDSDAYYKIRVTYFNYDSGGGKQQLKDGNNLTIHDDIITSSTPAQYEFIIPKSSYAGGSLTLNFINSLYPDNTSSRAAISEIWLMQISSDEANVPTITDVDPANGSFLNFSPAALTITFTSSDSGLNAENSIFSVNEITGTRTLSGNQFIFTPTTPSQFVDAEYTIHVRLEDNKGVQGDDTYYHFTVDTKEPAAPVVDYPVVSSVHNPNQTITVTREAYAAILLNGKEIVGHTEETTWPCSVELLEDENILSFRAKDRAGNISEPAEITITFDDTAPAAVEGLSITTGLDGTSVRLNWPDDYETAQGDIESYSVYAETSDFNSIDGLAKIATVNAGNFTCTVRNLEQNTKYYFAVVAVDKAGNTGGVHTVFRIPVVTGLEVKSYADHLIFLWNPVIADDLKGYRITFDQVTEPSLINGTSIQKNDLDPATQYSFSIIAVDNDDNESPEAAINGVTFLPNPLNVAAIPLDSGVRLSWDAVEPPEYLETYNIYQSTDEFSDVTNMSWVKNTSDNTVLIDGLENGIPYYFAVTSVNISDGENEVVSSIPATPKTDTGFPVISGIQIDGKDIKDGYTLFDSATLTFNVTDDTGVENVNIYLDDISVEDFSYTMESCSYELALERGSHTLKIEAIDIYGHQDSEEYQIFMSNGLPFECFDKCIEIE